MFVRLNGSGGKIGQEVRPFEIAYWPDFPSIEKAGLFFQAEMNLGNEALCD